MQEKTLLFRQGEIRILGFYQLYYKINYLTFSWIVIGILSGTGERGGSSNFFTSLPFADGPGGSHRILPHAFSDENEPPILKLSRLISLTKSQWHCFSKVIWSFLMALFISIRLMSSKTLEYSLQLLADSPPKGIRKPAPIPKLLTPVPVELYWPP